jgi:hypothetical protein
MKKDYIIVASVALLIAILLLAPVYIYRGSAQEEVINVEMKERVNSDKYLVFTEDEVFENTDSIPFLKFASSDLYNDLKVDGEYKVKVAGWRIPVFSMYRNIISIE